MEVNFRIVLLVVGVVFLAGILIHGLMSIRKPSKRKLRQEAMDSVKNNRVTPKVDDLSDDDIRDQEGFDPHGVGVARVVKNSPDSTPTASMVKASHPYKKSPEAGTPPVASERISPVFNINGINAAGDTTDEKTQNNEPVPSFSAKPETFTETLAEESHKIDSDDLLSSNAADIDTTPRFNAEPEPQTPAAEPIAPTAPSTPQDVLVLNVCAKDGDEISGAVLLPTLLTLGLKYGEMQIFHRHQDSAGNGEVLFSLANMVKPGTFDVDNMETFSTQGLSLFMTLPGAGDGMETFNLMLSAAAKLAESLGAQVLDDKRCVLTKKTTQQYVQRIRDVERELQPEQ